MKIVGIIPARYASSRFPGKPLADIGGKSMIQRVYEQASSCRSLDAVFVATDDERIENAVKEFGGEVQITRPDHPSGTDRCAEVLEKRSPDADIVINIQGDEPFINPDHIEALCKLFQDPDCDIATLVKSISDTSLIDNPNCVKTVLDNRGFALYFSRAPIPFQKNVPVSEWLKIGHYFQHLGIYGYRADVLREVVQIAPGELEKTESLEQLRWLQNGYKIKTGEVTGNTISVDTPEDLEKIRAHFGL